MDDFLTVEDAAKELGVESRLVRYYISKGHLPAEKVSRVWLIRRADLKKFTKPRRGAKPADPVKDAKTLRDWHAARAKGITREQFAAKRGMTVAALDKAIGRATYQQKGKMGNEDKTNH